MDLIKNISIIFMSIFLESLPFLLLGSFISSIIETYVSDETIARIVPKNKILGTLVGIFLGLFIPACDCAVIPISKRLIKKRVPLNVAVSFMLASPIINPVVLLSTYKAFYSINPKMFWFRLVLGITISFVIGIIIGILFKDTKVLNNDNDEHEHDHHCNCDSCHDHHRRSKKNSKLMSIIYHTEIDLFEVVKYLMFGALLASLFQVIIPRSLLGIFKDNSFLSTIILMIFAYLVSLCSTSDSFVGKSLLNIFPSSAVLAYLILGPMIDIKNTVVLLGNYNKTFTYVLITLIFVFVLLTTIIIGGLV
jgi:hypothetical protein